MFVEISVVYRSTNVCYEIVHKWKKKFDSGLESIKNAPYSRRPNSAFCDEIVSKVKEIVERDARYTVRDIARMVGLSLSGVHCILKNMVEC